MWGFFTSLTCLKWNSVLPSTLHDGLEAFQEFRMEIRKQAFEVSWLTKIHQVSAKICTKASPDMLRWNLTTVTQTKPKHTSCVLNFNYFAVVGLFCASQAFNHLWTDIFLIILPLFIVASFVSHVSHLWALSVHIDLTPWLLPIVLFHILIVCVSLWSFDCFSWSLRSLSNLFIVAQYCFVTVLCHCFVILAFLWSPSSLFIHFACLHVCFESGVYHICNIWKSKPIILIILSHFARLHGCFGTVLASL